MLDYDDMQISHCHGWKFLDTWTLGVREISQDFLRQKMKVIKKKHCPPYFNNHTVFLFLFCSGVLMAVSKATKPQSAADLILVTFQKRSSNFSFKWTSDVGLSIVLIMAVLCLWVLFSPFGIG